MLTLTRFLKVILIFFVLILLVVLVKPLLSENIFQGHDMWVQMMFMKRFQEALIAGQFPVYYINGLYPGWDGPHFIFYQPAFYYIFTFISSLGFTNVASLNISVLGLWILSGVFMYLFAKKYLGVLGGILAGVFYILAPYHIAQVYVRGALAEFAAVTFIPAIFWGLSSFSEKQKARYFFLTALFTSLFLLSHTVTIIIFVPIILLFLGFLFLQEKNLRSLFLRVSSLVLGIGIASFSIIPAFLELKFSNLSVKTTGASDFHNHFICFSQLFSNSWGYGGSIPGCGDSFPFGIGIIHWVGIILVIIFLLIFIVKKTPTAKQKIVGLFLVFFIYSLFMVSGISVSVWEKVPYLAYLQFPWRFLTLTAFSSAFIAGGLVVFIKKTEVRFLICALMILFALVAYSGNVRPSFYLSEKVFNFNNEYFVQGLEPVFDKIITTPDDFGPIWEKKTPEHILDVPNSLIVTLTGSAKIDALKLSPADKRYYIEASESAQVRFFTHYFPGWKVIFNGQEVAPFYENGYGYMDVNFPKGNYDVTLKFTNTPVRDTAQKISVISLMVSILSAIFLRRLFY